MSVFSIPLFTEQEFLEPGEAQSSTDVIEGHCVASWYDKGGYAAWEFIPNRINLHANTLSSFPSDNQMNSLLREIHFYDIRSEKGGLPLT